MACQSIIYIIIIIILIIYISKITDICIYKIIAGIFIVYLLNHEPKKEIGGGKIDPINKCKKDLKKYKEQVKESKKYKKDLQKCSKKLNKTDKSYNKMKTKYTDLKKNLGKYIIKKPESNVPVYMNVYPKPDIYNRYEIKETKKSDNTENDGNLAKILQQEELNRMDNIPSFLKPINKESVEKDRDIDNIPSFLKPINEESKEEKKRVIIDGRIVDLD